MVFISRIDILEDLIVSVTLRGTKTLRRTNPFSYFLLCFCSCCFFSGVCPKAFQLKLKETLEDRRETLHFILELVR